MAEMQVSTPAEVVATGLPRLAVTPVVAMAGAVGILLVVTAHRYGLAADELYFIVAGQRLSWGYADQPPFVPLIAAAADAVAPGSALVLRLPAAAVTAASVVVAALIARELGGRPRAQLLAAGVTAGCSYLVSTGRTVATSTFDPFWWSLVLWLIMRWVRIEHIGQPHLSQPSGGGRASVHRHDRLLLAAGVVVAVGLLTKLLMLGLVAGLAAGVLLVGPRWLLRRPLARAAAVTAGLALMPTLIWQGTHGWPQVGVGGVIGGEADLFGGRWELLPFALLGAGLVPGAVLVSVGWWSLIRTPALRPWRFIGVAVLVVAITVIVLGGRSYYLGGFYVTLFAAGAVAFQHRADQRSADRLSADRLRADRRHRMDHRRWVDWTVAPVTVAVFAVLNTILALPVGPVRYRIGTDFVSTMQVGWPDLADSVADRYRRVLADEGGTPVIVASSYWNASALDYYGPAHGLPTVYSGHRGYGFFGAPPGTTPALLVGNVAQADQFCAVLRPFDPHTATIPNPTNGHVPISYCRPRQPWVQIWPTLRTL